jgi:hypothetical protein
LRSTVPVGGLSQAVSFASLFLTPIPTGPPETHRYTQFVEPGDGLEYAILASQSRG